MGPRFSQEIKIANLTLNQNSPCLIIAEIGVNHNGDIDLAKKLILEAKQAGVDAVKFQSFRAEELVTRQAKMAKYQVKNIGQEESQFDMLKKLELSDDAHIEIIEYCRQNNIMFLSTPFGPQSVALLDKLNIPVYKIGSSDTNNIPHLINIARKGKPMIISTGMSTWQDISDTLDVITPINNKIILLQCTTDYPCAFEDANVGVLETFEKEFGCLVGFSDHTPGINAALVACSLNAKVIEKHFTLDCSMPGPDHKASLEPPELKSMVAGIRELEKITLEQRKAKLKNEKWYNIILGSSEKQIPVSVENSGVRLIAQKSLVLSQDIPAGTVITEEMLTIKRPGTGISPKFFQKILGRSTVKNLKADQLLMWEDLHPEGN